MAKKPDPLIPAANQRPVPHVVDGGGHAPIVFFDEAPTFGNNGHVVNVLLCAYRNMPDANQVIETDLLVTAHLRCSIGAAVALRNALNDALLLGAKTEGGSN